MVFVRSTIQAAPLMSTNSLTRSSGSFRCLLPSFRSPRSWPTVGVNASFPISRTHARGHGSTPSSLFTSAPNRKRSPHLSKEDSVGPFQLGIPQAALRREETFKKWSELSVGGKVMRTTQRATNLTIILLGAGLSAVLVYALTSELFSKNSPTVLYNDACERIKSSPRVAKYLHGPLAFHNDAPSSVRPRHRHRRVASQITVDSSGREHMLLNFYIHGSSSEAFPTADGNDGQWASYVSSLASLTLEDIKEKTSPFVDSVRSTFRYLRGDPVTSVTSTFPTDKEKSKEVGGTEEQTWWELTGLFFGLRGRRPHDGGSHGIGTAWREGEVHADLVRNDEGYFVFRYLLIDIPNSESRNPIRIFVERAAGVRENEPIMRLHSS